MDFQSAAETSLQQLKAGEELEAQGNEDGALRVYREALVTIERLAQEQPGSCSFQFGLLFADSRIGDILARRGRIEEALAAYRAHHERVLATVLQNDSNLVGLGPALCASIEAVGGVLKKQGDGEGALKAYRGALAIHERIVAHDPDNPNHQRALGTNLLHIAELLADRGEGAEALGSYEKASAAFQRALEQGSPPPDLLPVLSVIGESIGEWRQQSGDYPGALQALREALAWTQQLKVQVPSHDLADFGLFMGWIKIGDLLLEMGDTERALEAYFSAVQVGRGRLTSDPDGEWMDNLTYLYGKIGNVFENAEKTPAKYLPRP